MTTMKSSLLLGSVAIIFASACSDPKPPPAPVKAMAPVAIAVPAAERPAEDPAALAKQLAALSGGQAAQPEVAAAAPAPAKRKVRRPLRPVEDSGSSEEAYQDPTKLSDAQFQNAIGNWRGVKACIAKATVASREASGSGAVKIAFTISGQGEVVTSKVYEFSNDYARTMGDCLEREAKRVKFPSFTAEASITKEAKFVF